MEALATEDLEPNHRHPHVLPYLVWEWLVVEAIVRTIHEDEMWGLPGSLVTRKAVSEHGYLDERIEDVPRPKTTNTYGGHIRGRRIARNGVKMARRPRSAASWLRTPG